MLSFSRSPLALHSLSTRLLASGKTEHKESKGTHYSAAAGNEASIAWYESMRARTKLAGSMVWPGSKEMRRRKVEAESAELVVVSAELESSVLQAVPMPMLYPRLRSSFAIAREHRGEDRSKTVPVQPPSSGERMVKREAEAEERSS